MAQTVKNLPATWETRIWSLGWDHPLEKGMTTYSSILTWRIPWTEEMSELQCMGLQSVQRNWATNVRERTDVSTCTHTQNKEQKTAPGKCNFETFTLPPTKNTKVCILRFIFWFKCQLEVLFEKSGRWERCLTKNDNLAQFSHVLVASSK